jgi:hypothetical protein
MCFLQYNEGKLFWGKGRKGLRRPIIPGLKEREQGNHLVTRPITTALELQERLRKGRNSSYMEVIGKLDTAIDVNIDSILQQIEQEFSDVRLEDQLLGIVAKCYLGSDYDIHLLDRNQKIMQHLKRTNPLPAEFKQARSLAFHKQYAFIEVYPDCLRAVSLNGEVSVVKE